MASPTKLNTGALLGSFVLGFTGVDVAGKRVGYAAFLPMNGAGCIGNGTACSGATPGFIDINDDGTASSAGDMTGSYSMNNGIGTMTFKSATLNKTFTFNLYGVGGQLNGNNPLTLFAISTDQITTNPAVSGTVEFQPPDNNGYNDQTFKGSSVSNLTGVDSTTGTSANVALTIATTDGSGNISGTFDQNNAGTITGPAQAFGTGYKYSPSRLHRLRSLYRESSGQSHREPSGSDAVHSLCEWGQPGLLARPVH